MYNYLILWFYSCGFLLFVGREYSFKNLDEEKNLCNIIKIPGHSGLDPNSIPDAMNSHTFLLSHLRWIVLVVDEKSTMSLSSGHE